MTRLNSVVSIECETNTHTLTRKASGAHHFVIAFVVTFQMMRNGLQRRKKINQANTFLVYFMPMSKIVTMIHMQTTFYNVQASILSLFFNHLTVVQHIGQWHRDDVAPREMNANAFFSFLFLLSEIFRWNLIHFYMHRGNNRNNRFNCLKWH